VKKDFVIFFIIISLFFKFSASAETSSFQYPCYMVDMYNPAGDCWRGMNAQGTWPVYVNPEKYVVGAPPAMNLSGITIPTDNWVELKFPGIIVDGPGDDIVLVELDQMGEKAIIFLTNGSSEDSHEYLLGMASTPMTGLKGPTQIGFDIANLPLSFVPSAVRIVGTDLLGGSPGFDLAYIIARTDTGSQYTASNPNPPDGTQNVSTDTLLSWSGGRSADSYLIYFGESLQDVDANAIPWYHLPQVEPVSFNPAPLGLGKTYYWRVDQLDHSENTLWTGDIWSLKTADHSVLENFESYIDLIDSWISRGSGSTSLSREVYHGCRQAMEFRYQCSNDLFSESTFFFEHPVDWSATENKTLVLFFAGSSENKPGAQMNLAIGNDTSYAVFPYTGDPNNLLNNQWQKWIIDLETISGPDFSDIEFISIGFVGANSHSGSLISGTIYFDDITLYTSYCDQQNKPAADFDCDCIVGFKDLDELTTNWLESGYNVYPVSAPNEPLAWYKFDGNANDSIGSTNAQISGTPSFEPGLFGQAIKFDGFTDYVEVGSAGSVFSNINEAITICFWQNGTESSHRTDTLFCTNFKYGLYDPPISINLGCWKEPGKYNWDCGVPLSLNKRLTGYHQYSQYWQGQWNHWAFTKDARNGIMQVFLNGRLLDSRTGSDSLITGVLTFRIGSGWYGGYDGLIDDLQIFNYALTEPEIAYVATGGTGEFNRILATPADLNYDNLVNFKDFAVLADNWLGNQ
jgi:hypothetical protein